MGLKAVKIRQNQDYITLNNFLKIIGVISTGGEAKMFLMSNDVYVNDELESRRGRKLKKGDKIKIYNQEFIIDQ